MILLGVNVQNRNADVSEIHWLVANLDLTLNQFVSLIEISHELSVSPDAVTTPSEPIAGETLTHLW